MQIGVFFYKSIQHTKLSIHFKRSDHLVFYDERSTKKCKSLGALFQMFVHQLQASHYSEQWDDERGQWNHHKQ